MVPLQHDQVCEFYSKKNAFLNEYYERAHVNPLDVYKPHMNNLPIPQGVLDLLGAGYPQNEGYAN